MLIGAGVALLTSLAWAVSSILLKSLTGRIDILSINTIRMWVGSALLLTIAFAAGKMTAIQDMPLQSLGCVVLSGILAMAVGDTLYIKTLSMLDASVAFTISQCAFVVVASLGAVLLLGESYTWVTVAGAMLVMVGIYLTASGHSGKPGTRQPGTLSRKGVLLSLSVAVIWSVSTVTLKAGAIGTDAVAVAAVRITVSAMLLSAFTIPKHKQGLLQLNRYGLRSLTMMAAAGISTYGVAAVGYILAIQIIGAGKTVLLTTSAPLFALPFSIIFLGERPTRSTILGIIISVAGMCLVVV